jgi:putative transposase
MRAVGYAVEPICAVLREQCVQVAARIYRAWKTRLPALRTIEDARITDALRSLKVPDTKGRPPARDHLRTAEDDAVAAPERFP